MLQYAIAHQINLFACAHIQLSSCRYGSFCSWAIELHLLFFSYLKPSVTRSLFYLLSEYYLSYCGCHFGSLYSVRYWNLFQDQKVCTQIISHTIISSVMNLIEVHISSSGCPYNPSLLKKNAPVVQSGLLNFSDLSLDWIIMDALLSRLQNKAFYQKRTNHWDIYKVSTTVYLQL